MIPGSDLRPNSYLEDRLEYLWQTYFADVKRLNPIRIRFGRRCFKRLGTIRRANISGEVFDSLILINGHFRDPFIPEYVIDATIVHELSHYIHGISSAHPRRHKYPHRGGIIDQELAERGLTALERQENQWLQQYWQSYVRNSVPAPNTATKPACTGSVAVLAN